MSPHAQVRIDLAAIEANVAAVGERAAGAHPAGHAPALMSVVKADAYGHGLVPVARAALAGGATFLGTAVFAEALALRAAGVGGRVLAWLAAPGEDYAAVLGADIEIGVSSRWQLAEVVAAAAATGRPAAVHLKVDTGLGRNGCPAASWPELVAAAAAAQASGAVRVAGVFSHLACSDTPDHPATDEQLAAFAEARRVLDAAGVRPEFVHLANSAATLTRPDTHFDLLRVGLATYGLSPIPDLATAAELGLVPAMRLSARLAGVKDVPAGQGVSYDLTYRTPTATRLGLVPLGYADGIPRSASGGDSSGPGGGPGGPVLVGGPVTAGGRVHRIVGRVAMDQVVLDLGPGSSAEPGDEVVLFGSGAAGEPTAQDWAAAADTISYEITTRIARHVPRVHVGAAGGSGVGAAAEAPVAAGIGGTVADRLPPWLRGPAGMVAAAAGVAAAGVAIGVAVQRNAVASLSGPPAAATPAAAVDGGGVPYGSMTGEPALVSTDDGQTLHAEIDGAGSREGGREGGHDGPPLPTVVLVHGFALDCRTWHHQRLDLSRHTRVISYDQRGHGRSTVPPERECTVDRLAEDLRQVLDELVPEGPVVLVGHSMGGMTILALAQAHPELFGDRVRGVGFICTSAGTATDSGVGEIAGFGPLAAVASAAVTLSRSANHASQVATGGLLNLVAGAPTVTGHARQLLRGVERTLNRYYSFATPVSPALARFVLSVNSSTPISVVAGLYASLVHVDLWAALPPLAGLPCLVVVGDQDRVTPPSHGRALAARLPGSRLLELSPAGHLAFLEYPGEVDAALLELLRAAA